MSCNYYRVMPEPPRPETFGFKKVTQEELGNIISRLSRPTYNSRVHTVEAHKAHNYRKIHSAPPPRTPTLCSRRRFSTPTPNNIINTTTTSNSNHKDTNNEPATSTPSPNPLTSDDALVETSNQVNVGDNDNDNVDNKNSNTENNAIDENGEGGDNDGDDENNDSEHSTPALLLPSPPPPPPVPLSQRKMTELELRRFLRRIQRPTRAHVRSRRDYVPEEDDEIMAGDDFATFNAGDQNRRPLTATERKKAFFLMSRPTTASKAKSSVECVFCPTDEEELKANRNLELPFKYPHAPETKVVSSGEASSIVSRVSSPTRASLRGGGPPCYRATPDYDAVRGQHPSLPLVSGLARTPNVSQIVNRLHYGTTKRLVVVIREEEEEADRGCVEEDSSMDRRGSRGTSSGDERERLYRGSSQYARHQHQQQRRRDRPASSGITRVQSQNGRRSYHGYRTAATPITAWS